MPNLGPLDRKQVGLDTWEEGYKVVTGCYLQKNVNCSLTFEGNTHPHTYKDIK